MNKRGSSSATAPFTNPVLVGASIVVALVIGVFLSYNANRGLPFVKTFKLTAQVPDAAELVVGSEVRIGGFRVGQVNGITAMPPKGERPPYAELDMALDGSVTGIPANTIVRVRPRSLLGSKYVELTPGEGGREVETGGVLPLRNARTTPSLDETFNVFDADTRRGLQGTIRGFGDALAGRGEALNRTIGATSRLLPPAQRVVDVLADPETGLSEFVDGLAGVTSALAPVAGTLADLFDNGATTLEAIDRGGDALGRALEVLPETERVGLDALLSATPVVGDLADIAVQLRPGSRRLPEASRRLAAALDSGTRVLRRTPELATPLEGTLRSLRRVSRDPAAAGSLRKLTETVDLLLPTLQYLGPGQTVCNMGAIFARNLGGTISQGDSSGNWLSFMPIMRNEQVLRFAEPDTDLHVNPYPVADATECEAGNEPYAHGRAIGNPAGLQPTTTDETAPPEVVTARARSAGLLDHIPGARR
jgi:virulence factor Mce-like protein